MTLIRLPRLAAVVLVAAGLAVAGGRARYGGTLRVAVVGKSLERDPLLADTPAEAAASLLSSAPPCRLGSFESPSPTVLRLLLPPAVAAETVKRALERVRASRSPYRALLAPVTSITAGPGVVELGLSSPTPELERVLCHPALGVGVGPFSPETLLANPTFPLGRPYADGVTFVQGDARSAERLLAQRRVHVVLGSGAELEGQKLFATWLLSAPALSAHLKQAVDSSVDRGDLVRFFVHPPAAAMAELLPPSQGGGKAPFVAPSRPQALAPALSLTLLYDQALDDHRAVAERLQVKLLPLGYRVVLQGLSRPALRTRWAGGDFELMLFSALLPEAPGASLALTAELARAGGPAPGELFGLADERAIATRAEQLRASLPLVPLFLQGLAVSATREVRHLVRSEAGLPRLEDAFLSPD